MTPLLLETNRPKLASPLPVSLAEKFRATTLPPLNAVPGLLKVSVGA